MSRQQTFTFNKYINSDLLLTHVRFFPSCSIAFHHNHHHRPNQVHSTVPKPLYPTMTTSTLEDNQNPLTSNPEDTASFFSNLFLTYLDPIFKVGAQRPLQSSDLGPPNPNDESNRIHQLLLKEFEKMRDVNTPPSPPVAGECAPLVGGANRPTNKKKQRVNVAKALWLANGPHKIYLSISLYLMSSLLTFVPVLIRK